MTLILTAAALFAVAAIMGWVAPLARRRRPLRRGITIASWLLSIAGAVLVVISAATVLAGDPIGDLAGDVVTGSALRLDRLAALFLIISFGVAIPALISAIAASAAHQARIAAGVAVVLLAALIAISGGNLFTLLLGWEGLGFAFYLVVGYDRRKPGTARAAVLVGGFSVFSGAAILVAGSLLFASSHSLDLATIADHAPPAVRDTAYLLLIAGFVVKVGLMPLHLWLPPSYTAAPGPARAILAGAAVNVGFYGLWRTLDILGAPPAWLACGVLIVGGLTAILGIAHATVHADLAYLISWSSVENAGIIVTGYGVALVGALTGSGGLLAAGLVAATAQACAHALGKSLLFVATAGIEDAYRSTDLDKLRAVARQLPFSGTGLVIGALTLAGVPLTAGFASEWLTIEALMQQFRVHDLPVNLSLAVAGVLVALTVGVASVAFVRLIALTAFGRDPIRLTRGRRRYERNVLHRLGIVVLVLGCLGTAAIAPLEIRMIASGLYPVTGGDAEHVNAGSWTLQPVYSGFSALSPSWLWIVIPGYVVLIVVLSWAISGRRFLRVRKVTPWASASPGVVDGHGYTSFAFANPMRKVLATVLLTRGELRREELATGGRVGNEDEGARGVQLGYTVDVVDVIERYLYRPLIPAGRWIVRTAQRLQSGRLDAYMAYMLIAVVAILAVVSTIAQASP
jgi:formate hydrogenlyase subunit 3/multisubunit Na+/H+ antiporter MnhD subunit